MFSDADFNIEKELISPLSVGFHMHGQPAGSAPLSSKYRFEGVLICLMYPSTNNPGARREA